MAGIRLAFGGGLLLGTVTGVFGAKQILQQDEGDKRVKTAVQKLKLASPNIHIEYTEAKDKYQRIERCGDILPFGAPQRGPDISCYSNHVLSYDQARRTPLWVAEHLTKENLVGNANRKKSNFRFDPSIPEMFRAQNSDYKNSNWSRGHMSPAGDNKRDQTSMDESFLLSNIVPQDYKNNGGFWNRFEMYCRDLTERFSNVYVISGPLMVPTVDPTDGKKYIKYQVVGNDNVAVPTHLYKVIVADGQKGLNLRDARIPALGAFIVPNIPISFDHQLPEYQVELEDVERQLGVTLLPELVRGAASDLCVVDGCKLQSKKDFDLYVMNRRLANSTTPAKLNSVWKEMEQKGITPDAYSENTYNKKIQEFAHNEKQSKEE